MSGATQEFQFPLRVVLNQQENKVLYTTVSRDFVDVLLSFFTLPLGTIVRLLVRQYQNEAPSLGSLSSLYKGLKDLDITNFSWDVDRWLLLRPINSFEVLCRKLRLKIDDTKYDICPERCTKDVMYHAKLICCGDSVNVETPSSGGVFVTSPQSFIITDDLKIFPDLPEYGLRILRDVCGVKNTNVLRERTVSFGYLEMMKLLKCSLISKTPLTEVIINERTMISANPVDILAAPFVPHMVKYLRKLLMSKKTRVTAFVQKSTNRILSVQAQEDFVDFLFSLLTIPLGKAEFLLHGDTGLGSVDNLYRCIPSLNVRKCINTENHSINSLLNPTIPPNYVSVNRILPLTQKSSHTNLLSKYDDFKGGYQRHLEMSASRDIDHYELKGLKPNAYMVTDDLVVTTSSVSKLQATGIPLNDIETHVLDIGIEETLNILKASLTSSFALTNGLKKSLRRRKTRKMKFFDLEHENENMAILTLGVS